MDTNTLLGLALIITQTGWGIAAWKASQANKKQMVEHQVKDDANFAELRQALNLQAV
jgi:hypothetical protein